MAQTTTQPTFDVEAIRQDFPILQKPLPNGMPLVYLDSGASAQKPRQVIEKEVECYQNYYANAHRGVYQFGVRIDEELERVREKLQKFMGAAEPEEIIFTSGTTMSINLVAIAWGRKFIKAGDLSANLCKAGTYNQTQHKAVVAWLGIRNNAAHGDYDSYKMNQINDLLNNIRSFISNYCQ